MRKFPRIAQIYIVCSWLIMATLVISMLVIAFPPPDHLLLLPLWVVVYIITDYFEVDFTFEDEKRLRMSVYEAAIIFLVAVSGVYALPAILIGSLITDSLHHREWYRSLFNASERVMTYTAMWVVYHAIAPVGGLPYTGPFGLLALLATALTYYVLNTLIIGTVIALTVGQPIPRVIREAYSKVHWVHFLTLPLGAILAALWFVDRWIVLAGVVPLIVAQRSFQALASWQLESRRNTILARQVEQLQDITTTMVTSLNPSIVLETMSVRLAQLLQATSSWVVLPDMPGSQVAAIHGPLPVWVTLMTSDLIRQRPHSMVELSSAQLPIPLQDGQNVIDIGTQALVAIPMALEQRVLGYICLAFVEPIELSESQRRVLQAFAAQAALVMEHANLFDALRHNQNELIRSSKLAALGTFSAGIAHEFNNILAGILGYAQLGMMSDDRENQRESLLVIEQSCVRARNITSGLLAFARRSPPQRRLNLVQEAIEAALVLIERELVKANILVERHYGPIPPTICDNDQLAQVVLNLLTNARDAMIAQGSGTITISVEQHNNMIELRVRDTGSGIPAELLEQVFQPFMTTKGALGGSTTPGTGLGLAISYGIIESHDGTIAIESQVGLGTTVIVQLPIVDDPEMNAADLSSSGTPHELRVLVVDDDPQVLHAISQLLTQHGHQVRIAESGARALQIYKDGHVDLVLSDVVMPGMDGIALLLQLQAIDPQVHMLMMTGQTNAPPVEHMLKAGAIGPIVKPFTIDELLDTISHQIPDLMTAPN